MSSRLTAAALAALSSLLASTALAQGVTAAKPVPGAELPPPYHGGWKPKPYNPTDQSVPAKPKPTPSANQQPQSAPPPRQQPAPQPTRTVRADCVSPDDYWGRDWQGHATYWVKLRNNCNVPLRCYVDIGSGNWGTRRTVDLSPGGEGSAGLTGALSTGYKYECQVAQR